MLTTIASLLVLDRWNVPDQFQQTMVVEPVHPLERHELDISEMEEEIIVKVEIPGVSVEDVDISIADNHLIIKGEKSQESEAKDQNYCRVGRFYGSFRRSPFRRERTSTTSRSHSKMGF